MTQKHLKYFSPILFFILMLFDAQLTQRLLSSSVWRAHLMLIIMIFATRYLPKGYMLVVSLCIGIVFDLYYLGLIGIYAVILPLIIWLVYLVHPFLFENIFNLFFGMIIFITAFESLNVSLQLIFNLITVNPLYFVTKVLGPTLLLNMGLFCLSIYPAKKIFWK
ncbi:rod shape-determining protein MreD [Enterococcus sp.]|uniref:rod shape-determining protein MreD n=1 Tax=Enterococcus sp. TaxID=35783 RepID=UPI002FC8E3B4